MRSLRLLLSALAAAVVWAARAARAAPPWEGAPVTSEGRREAAPEPATDTPHAEPPAALYDGMHLLSVRGQHDLDDERWNAYAQLTLIGSYKAPFHAAYTSLNGSGDSLSAGADRSYTGSATVFLGARLWKGSELYEVPELISERPLSGLTGLGGTIQNFELELPRSRGRSDYAAIFAIFSLMNFNSNSIGLT